MTMRRSHHAIPIIKLWDLLLVPLQGDVTDEQAEKLSADVLDLIQKTEPKGLVIDVSGLELLDSYLCSLVASLAASAKLMGVRVVISGLSSEIAITLQTMGISFGDVRTTLSLEDGLYALGLKVVRAPSPASSDAEPKRPPTASRDPRRS
jgi:rsbT antagonist protein RsbS